MEDFIGRSIRLLESGFRAINESDKIDYLNWFLKVNEGKMKRDEVDSYLRINWNANKAYFVASILRENSKVK